MIKKLFQISKLIRILLYLFENTTQVSLTNQSIGKVLQEDSMAILGYGGLMPLKYNELELLL